MLAAFCVSAAAGPGEEGGGRGAMSMDEPTDEQKAERYDTLIAQLRAINAICEEAWRGPSPRKLSDGIAAIEEYTRGVYAPDWLREAVCEDKQA